MRLLLGILLAAPQPAAAQRADSAAIHLRVVLDAYYAHDPSAPPRYAASFAGGHPFTSEAARHGRPAINLAFIEARAGSGRVEGRLALQAGTAVDVRHDRDMIAGARTGRFLHEATLAVRPWGRDALKAGVGIYPSWVGLERHISSENPTYTRSLVYEFAPRRHAGAWLAWSPRRWLATQLHLVNGWDDAWTDMGSRGAGLRADWTPTEGLTVRGYNLIVRGRDERRRRLHGVGARAEAGPFDGLLQIDLGSHENSAALGRPAHWYGYTIASRWRVTRRGYVNARFERFDDDEQIVARSGSSDSTANSPFRGYGESVGFDFARTPRLWWRAEVRAFQNSGRSFWRGSGARSGRSAAVGVVSVIAGF